MKNKITKLTPEQELFCNLFASDREFFGNGVESYQEAYSTEKKPISYKVAKAAASRLLTNVNILKRIDELMDIEINDRVVDKELGKVIKQDAEFSSKVKAINEWNKVKGRHAAQKFEVTDPHAILTDEEVEDKLNKLLDERIKK